DGHNGVPNAYLHRDVSVESLDGESQRATHMVRSTTTRKWRRRVDGAVHTLLYGSTVECQMEGTQGSDATEHKRTVESLQARILYLEGVAARAHELEMENKRLRALLDGAAIENGPKKLD